MLGNVNAKSAATVPAESGGKVRSFEPFRDPGG